ncbi:MAG: hypothetical protein CMA77_03090 [Euryarchaeota archaeon]|nr:hypothetical protein [Euryarchaeota archaeon]|tara:strand:- start:309 stop:521 length:213 start_codon:yes stop_codon:yes gene_type:complete
MTPRNWFGVALIILFLPVNAPLWETVFELFSMDISAIPIVPVIFLFGLIILFYPARDKQTSDNPNNDEEE